MKIDSSIPVIELAECQPGAEFIIKTTGCADVPSYLRKAHRNSGYKIGLLLEGTVTSYTDFKQYTASGPALLFLSPNQVYQHVGYQYHKMIHISFTKDFLLTETENVLSGWECMFHQVVIPVLNHENFNELKIYAELMQKEFMQLRPQNNLIIKNLLNAFVISAGRLTSCTSQAVSTDSSQTHIVRRFKNLTDENFMTVSHVARYAEMLYITPGHLNDIIKSATGRTAKQIIDEKRIIEAKRLLFWGEYSVKEIANRLNFEDDAYFNRFFKKHTGQPPALFQRASRKKYN
jgi:AraC-like DNA-binding protein